MVTPQAIAYIRQQFAAGLSKEDISKALIGNGWQVVDINEAFESVAFASMPVAVQLPPQNLVQPVSPASHKGVWATIIILLLLIGGGSAFAAYKYNLYALFVPSAPAAAPTASSTVPTTKVSTTSSPVAVTASTTPAKSGLSSTTPAMVAGLATTTYVNTTWKYRITPPQEWSALNLNNADGSNSEAFGEPDRNLSHAVIHIEARKSSMLTKAQIDAAAQKLVNLPGSKVLEKTDSTVGSAPASLVHVTLFDGTTENLTFLTSGNGYAYVITAEANADRWISYEALFRSVIASFAPAP